MMKQIDRPMFTGRQLFSLLWPLMAEQLLAVFVGMVDVLMVSSVGETAVSGVALVDSINILIIQILFGLTSGGAVVCARCAGNGDYRGASHSGAQMLTLTVSFAAVVSTLLLVSGRFLLRAIFGQIETAVMQNAYIYLNLTVLSFPFLAMYNSGAAIFRSAGNTRVSLVVSLIMNVLNIAGNALCIFGLKMGVEGVAIPTVISRGVAAMLILMWLQRPPSAFRIESAREFVPDWPVIRRICAIGIPSGMESGIFQFGKLTLQSLVSTMGTASIAAYAVASNLVTYLYLPGNALGAGMLTVVGQCVGANRMDEARAYAWRLVLINYCLLAVICSIMISGRHILVGWYNLSAESAGLAQGLVLIHAIAMVIWPLAFLFPYYFRATGNAAKIMVIAIFSMWVFRVGLAHVYIRVLHMNVLGAWYAMFVDWIFRAIVFMLMYRRMRVAGRTSEAS